WAHAFTLSSAARGFRALAPPVRGFYRIFRSPLRVHASRRHRVDAVLGPEEVDRVQSIARAAAEHWHRCQCGARLVGGAVAATAAATAATAIAAAPTAAAPTAAAPSAAVATAASAVATAAPAGPAANLADALAAAARPHLRCRAAVAAGVPGRAAQLLQHRDSRRGPPAAL